MLAPFAVLLALLGVLGGAGVALGAGIGHGVAWVRHVWPEPAAPLVYVDKVAPPRPATLPEPGLPCPASALRLELYPNVAELLPGQMVTLDAVVTNVGRVACTVDNSQENKHIEVVNAADEVMFTTEHCTFEGETTLLEPGQSVSQSRRWSGRASAPGVCQQGQQLLWPGTYWTRLALADTPGALGEALPIEVVAAAAPGTGEPPAIQDADPAVTD
ncbi:MAG: hypothetical protein FWG11_00640 [Promicromonosporaceae bacterium]|nr:hypothetical protein [Promicromonosporaceae bacterium]